MGTPARGEEGKGKRRKLNKTRPELSGKKILIHTVLDIQNFFAKNKLSLPICAKQRLCSNALKLAASLANNDTFTISPDSITHKKSKNNSKFALKNIQKFLRKKIQTYNLMIEIRMLKNSASSFKNLYTLKMPKIL